MWLKIEHLKEFIKREREMFVVKGFGCRPSATVTYDTDPYCVWLENDGSFARWPHKFNPTHFCVLPVVKE